MMHTSVLLKAEHLYPLGHTGVSQREGLQRKAHSKGGTTAARTCSEKPDGAPRFLLGGGGTP